MIIEECPTVLRLKHREDFVVTPQVESCANRALSYLEAGYPVHFSGPTGTGKTSMALYVAERLGQPVILIHGDEEYGSSDLVGGIHGYRFSKVVDNFIHSVLKTEETVRKQWVDNRLTTACKHGFTLLYDEFNRSRPEANNALLPILEEKVLELANVGEPYLQVNPKFKALFTSNPMEYAGVHTTQNALIDRMVTIKLHHFDRDSEIAITQAKSGLPLELAEKVVAIVRDFREQNGNHRPTVRASIMIARVVAQRCLGVSPEDTDFAEVCRDVLCMVDQEKAGNGQALKEKVNKVLEKQAGWFRRKRPKRERVQQDIK
ncbi:MAG: gas vesicle protein GvpN [Candidatus Brocadiales bacterium]|nr:gas vesicle protein GvpN [Candidatus Brocadiales bacterium]